MPSYWLARYGDTPFAALEREYRTSGLARNVLLLMMKLHQSESEILSWPLERINSYVAELNKLQKEGEE